MFIHKSLVLAIVLLLTVIKTASTMTINVPADQPTVQTGLAAASSGDLVMVAPGTYYEHDLQMKSGVELKSSAGRSSTTIDAQHIGKCINAYGTPAGTTIDGFTLTNGAGIEPTPNGGAVYMNTSTLTITNCVISNSNSGYIGGGVYAVTSTPTITHCMISGNHGAAGGGGIYFQQCENALVDECVVFNNIGDSNGGIVFNLTTGRISNNEIRNNEGGAGGGISSDFGNLDIVGNVIHHNWAHQYGGGIYCGYFGVRNIRENTIVFNKVTSGSGNGAGIYCSTDAHPNVTNCIVAFSVEGNGIGCQGSGSLPYVTCSDFFGNNNGDGLCGADGGGNISADPRFCDPTSDNYRLDAGSPVATAPCGLMGALGIGCSPIAVEPTTWTNVKTKYR